MTTMAKKKSITVTFNDKEWYILEKLLSALNEDPEHYVHDVIVGLFDSDIDLAFGMRPRCAEKLHNLEKALRSKALPAFR
jgi:hypothetical protein